jgi:ankyrin repeat domain-containing protein 50
MDGLSAAASVIAVLQISESVISACYQYYKTAKGARKDILEVITMVKDLKVRLIRFSSSSTKKATMLKIRDYRF